MTNSIQSKAELIAYFEEKLSIFESQKDSEEYKDMKYILEQVKSRDLTKWENILQNDPTAYSWVFKNYICTKNRKGYKYPSYIIFEF